MFRCVRRIRLLRMRSCAAIGLVRTALQFERLCPNRSMRVTWKDGKTSLEINFVKKTSEKSQVVVQHSKLPDAKTAAKMKTYWAGKLDRLRKALE